MAKETQRMDYDAVENEKKLIQTEMNEIINILRDINTRFFALLDNESWIGKRSDKFFEDLFLFMKNGTVNGSSVFVKNSGKHIISVLEADRDNMVNFIDMAIMKTAKVDAEQTFENVIPVVLGALGVSKENIELAGSSLNPVKTIEIPKGLGSVHSYMGWQKITSETSNQYKFRAKVGQNFDDEGFGRVGDRYVVACTSTYGNVGDYVDFYQEDGTIIHGVIGDIKSQGDRGCTKWGHNNGHCIVEFVVNKDTWYRNGSGNHANPGSPNCHPEWNQDITKVINLGSYYDNPDGIYVS